MRNLFVAALALTCTIPAFINTHALTLPEAILLQQFQQQRPTEDNNPATAETSSQATTLETNNQNTTAQSEPKKESQNQQPKQPENETPAKPSQPQEVFAQLPNRIPNFIQGYLAITNDNSQKMAPQFRVCFKGKETMSDEEGFFSIPTDDEKIDQFHLLFTKGFEQAFDKHNTIKNLQIPANQHYKCFRFNRWGRGGGQWIQREQLLDEKRIIPSDAIVIQLNPKYVDHLEEWKIDLSNNIIKLPKILLKKEVGEKTTTRAGIKSLLSSLDATGFHEEISEEIKIPGAKVKISLNR